MRLTIVYPIFQLHCYLKDKKPKKYDNIYKNQKL